MNEGRTLARLFREIVGERIELGLRAGELVTKGVDERRVVRSRLGKAPALHGETTAPSMNLSAKDLASHRGIEPIGDRQAERFPQNHERMRRLCSAMQHQTLQFAFAFRCDLEEGAGQ